MDRMEEQAGAMAATAAEAAARSAAELDEERLAWLALAMTPGLGPKRILDAVKGSGSAARVLSLALTELEALNLPASAAQFIFDGRARSA
ncbi:MAG TPA: hypothetical protein VKU93_03285, partial [Terracidiphilus sp.]|nr:hypothetical protein [Terracidiphilus sp.]